MPKVQSEICKLIGTQLDNVNHCFGRAEGCLWAYWMGKTGAQSTEQDAHIWWRAEDGGACEWVIPRTMYVCTGWWW